MWVKAMMDAHLVASDRQVASDRPVASDRQVAGLRAGCQA